MIRIAFSALFLFLLVSPTPACSARSLVVAYYDNPPIIFRDKAGNPAGFFTELLDHAARQNDWEISYQHHSWPDAFGMVRRGEVDLMPGVAFSEARAAYLAFNTETALTNWAHIYARPGLMVNSIFDIAGKSVLLQPGDINAEAFRNTMRRFGIAYTPIESMTFTALFSDLESGKADLGVVSHLFAASNKSRFHVHATPIVLNPIELRFAARKSIDPAVLTALDNSLRAMKVNSKSAYHQGMRTWFGAVTSHALPSWLPATMWGAGCAALLLALWTMALRKQVARKTHQLAQRNEDLEMEIDERRGAEAKLYRERVTMAGVIDSMPSLLAGVDARGIVTHWNHTAEERTGLSLAAVLNRPLSELLPHAQTLDAAVTESIKSGTAQHLRRVPVQGKDGTRYEDITVYPLPRDGVQGAMVRIDDVTERSRMEEVMIQTEKMLSIGGLAAGMAHEINNPLAVVLQSAQNILRRLSDELETNHDIAKECGVDLGRMRKYMEQRCILRYLEGIREAGARAADIVSRMLDFSRPSESRRAPTHPHGILEESLALAASDYDLTEHYDFRNITIAREYAPDLPAVPATHTELVQVVLNLLRNAAQAMLDPANPTPNPCILLRTSVCSGRVLIEVEDNGPGLDPETRNRVFEPFFTTKAPGIGTGLGLSVSYFIITQNHRGTFTVGPSRTGGTLFSITLPTT